MGTAVSDSVPFIFFASTYFIFVTIIYGLINPVYICSATGCEGELIDNAVNASFGSVNGFSFGNIILNFAQLGAWNLLIFSPFLITLAYIGGVLIIPDWV